MTAPIAVIAMPVEAMILRMIFFGSYGAPGPPSVSVQLSGRRKVSAICSGFKEKTGIEPVGIYTMAEFMTS
jgi:hypothetical protein